MHLLNGQRRSGPAVGVGGSQSQALESAVLQLTAQPTWVHCNAYIEYQRQPRDHCCLSECPSLFSHCRECRALSQLHMYIGPKPCSQIRPGNLRWTRVVSTQSVLVRTYTVYCPTSRTSDRKRGRFLAGGRCLQAHRTAHIPNRRPLQLGLKNIYM